VRVSLVYLFTVLIAFLTASTIEKLPDILIILSRSSKVVILPQHQLLLISYSYIILS
jgi:hypothetical protein